MNDFEEVQTEIEMLLVKNLFQKDNKGTMFCINKLNYFRVILISLSKKKMINEPMRSPVPIISRPGPPPQPRPTR